MRKIANFLKQISIYLTVTILFLFILLSIAPVQRFLASQVVERVNELYDTKIELKRFGPSPLGYFFLEGLVVKDINNDTLVSCSEVSVPFLSLKDLALGKLNFNSIKLVGLRLGLKTSKKWLSDSDSIDAKKNFLKKIKPITLSDIELVDGYFSFIRKGQRPFDLSSVNVLLKQVKIDSNKFAFDIENASFWEDNKLYVSDLKGGITYAPSSEELKVSDFKFNTFGSSVKGSLHVFRDSLSGSLEADVSLCELSTVCNRADTLAGKLALSTSFLGEKDSIVLQETKLALEDSYMTFDGLLSFDYPYNFRDHFLSLNLKQFKISGKDLSGSSKKPFIDKNFLIKTGSGQLRLRNGLLSSEFSLETNYGPVSNGSINVELPENPKEPIIFHGGLKADLKVRSKKLPGLEKLKGKFNYTASAHQGNFVEGSLDLDLDVVKWEGKKYEKIKLTGALKGLNTLDYKIVSSDPKLNTSVSGFFSKKEDKYELRASAKIRGINLFKKRQKLRIRGQVVLNASGTNLKDIQGSLALRRLAYKQYPDSTFSVVPNVVVATGLEENGIRKLSFESVDFVSGYVESRMKNIDYKQYLETMAMLLNSNSKLPSTTNDYLRWDIEIHPGASKISNLFGIDFRDKIQTDGVINPKLGKMNMHLELSFLSFLSFKAHNLNFMLDNKNSEDLILMKVDSIIQGSYKGNLVDIKTTALNDTLFFNLNYEDRKSNKNFVKTFYIQDADSKQKTLGVQGAKIFYKGLPWTVQSDRLNDNIIRFKKNKIVSISGLEVSNEEESIKMDSDKGGKILKVSLSNFNLDKFTHPITGARFSGLANGTIMFNKETYDFPQVDLKIKDLKIDTFLIGDITSRRRLGYKTHYTSIYKFGHPIFSLNTIFRKDHVVSTVDIEDMDIGFVNAILPKTSLSGIKGTLTGSANIDFHDEAFTSNGNFEILGGALFIPYTNVGYVFKEPLRLTLKDEKLFIEKLLGVDLLENTLADFSGKVTYKNKTDWNYRIKVNSSNLLATNLKKGQNPHFYGKSFASGIVEIYGDINKTEIMGKLASKEGTSIIFPIEDDGSESLEEDDFYEFKSSEEEVSVEKTEKESEDQSEITYLVEVKLDIDLNEKANFKIVLGESYISGYGMGHVLLDVKGTNQINVWGDFKVLRGLYTYSQQNVFKKEFQFVKGGTLTWDGSPYTGTVNMQARYQTSANPFVFLDSKKNRNQNTPVEVLIDVEGQMLKPDIDFSLKFPSLSKIDQDQINYSILEKSNLNTQAFFLIATNTFYNPQDNDRGTRTQRAITYDLINSFLNNKESKVNVGFDYLSSSTQGDESELPGVNSNDEAEINIRSELSKNIFFNGKIQLPFGREDSGGASANGEFTILLNKLGTLEAKVFHRQDNSLESGDGNNYQQGGGINYQIEF